MKLAAIIVLIIILVALLYSFVLRDERNSAIRIAASVIGAIFSMAGLLLVVIVPFVLLLAARYFFPDAIPADSWLDVLYVCLLVAAGQFMYEATIEKTCIAIIQMKKISRSLLLVIKTIATVVLIAWISQWLSPGWSLSMILVVAVLNTIIDYIIDRLSGENVLSNK